MGDAVLEVKDLHYTYSDGREALRGVTFGVKRGEKTAVVGANGSGKSTLLLYLAENFRGVGLTFQDADDEILMPSVIEDVSFSLVARGKSPSEARERAMEVLGSLGIAHLAERPPHRLSGGEKRMVTFAGVLAAEPEVLALDEPSAGLDPKARRRVIEFLRGADGTVILATHDLDMALEVCTRAVILSEGFIAAEGRLPELFRDGAMLEANGLELPLQYCCPAFTGAVH